MASNVVVAGDPAKTPPVVPGQTTPRNEGTTPSVPSKGQTTVLALTPKKKSKRLRTGEYAVESMPVLNLGTAKAPSIPKKSGGIDSSIFSGNREVAAPPNQNPLRNRITEQLEEIDSIQRARRTVIVDIAASIDERLEKYTQGHYLAAAKQAQEALTAALLTLIRPPAKELGTAKDLITLGPNGLGAQPPGR
ncbi:hypothetical protein GGI35DRAFT_484623, partial [Trichoderma velutinum]